MSAEPDRSFALPNEPDAQKTQGGARFSALAPDSDAGPGCFAYFGRRLVEETGIRPGQRVLDVASGRGAVLFPAAEAAGPDGAVVGVDLAAGMVQATRQEARRRGINAQVRLMDAEHLDFHDGSFDRVLCGFGVMFFPNQEGGLKEFRRVLKEGGRVGVSTWRASQAEDMADALRQLGFISSAPEPGWIAERARLAGLLERAGFSEVRVLTDSHTFRFRDLEEYWETARGTGMRQRLDPLNSEQRQRLRAALAERLAGRQRRNGIYLEATALLATANT